MLCATRNVAWWACGSYQTLLIGTSRTSPLVETRTSNSWGSMRLRGSFPAQAHDQHRGLAVEAIAHARSERRWRRCRSAGGSPGGVGRWACPTGRWDLAVSASDDGCRHGCGTADGHTRVRRGAGGQRDRLGVHRAHDNLELPGLARAEAADNEVNTRGGSVSRHPGKRSSRWRAASRAHHPRGRRVPWICDVTVYVTDWPTAAGLMSPEIATVTPAATA